MTKKRGKRGGAGRRKQHSASPPAESQSGSASSTEPPPPSHSFAADLSPTEHPLPFFQSFTAGLSSTELPLPSHSFAADLSPSEQPLPFFHSFAAGLSPAEHPYPSLHSFAAGLSPTERPLPFFHSFTAGLSPAQYQLPSSRSSSASLSPAQYPLPSSRSSSSIDEDEDSEDAMETKRVKVRKAPAVTKSEQCKALSRLVFLLFFLLFIHDTSTFNLVSRVTESDGVLRWASPSMLYRNWDVQRTFLGVRDALWEGVAFLGGWQEPPPPSPWEITRYEHALLMLSPLSYRVTVRQAILDRRLPRRDGPKVVFESYPPWVQNLLSPPPLKGRPSLLTIARTILADNLDYMLEAVAPISTFLVAFIQETWREGHWGLEWLSPELREWLGLPYPPPV
ncbi:MAG: hypothetical protein DHS80DRAFT_22926 [Piptocephalis tieghemiana]|nr:MAG: hypothetical protein DHS80DRAFT_22926 [Piptocephalis tieghemiana]